MVRTLRFHSSGVGGTLIPGWGIKIPQVKWHNQKKRKRRVSVVIKRTLERCFLRMGNHSVTSSIPAATGSHHTGSGGCR